LVDGGGRGMMFDNYSASVRPLGGGRNFYMSRGASADARKRLEKLVIDFFESKLSLITELTNHTTDRSIKPIYRQTASS
jgi:Mor family transcriptional regulator